MNKKGRGKWFLNPLLVLAVALRPLRWADGRTRGLFQDRDVDRTLTGSAIFNFLRRYNPISFTDVQGKNVDGCYVAGNL